MSFGLSKYLDDLHTPVLAGDAFVHVYRSLRPNAFWV